MIILIILLIILILIICVFIYKYITKKKEIPDNSILFNKDVDTNYTGRYTGTYTYKIAFKTIAIMNVDFTYKNKDNIILNNVSFDKCTAFPHGKNILSDCTNTTVSLNESDQKIVGSCIDTITSDGYINNVKIYSLKLIFSQDNIESIDVKLSVSTGITINETFKIPLIRKSIT